jgi:hypothetical protein
MWVHISLLLTLVLGLAIGLAAGRLSKRDEYIVSARRYRQLFDTPSPRYDEARGDEEAADGD